MSLLHKHLYSQCSFLRKTQPTLNANVPNRDRVAVIVEPRKHILLEPVIRNVMYFLGPGWNLEIITSDATVPHIKQCFANSTLRITTLPFVNMNQTLYNTLLMDPWFWHHLPEEHVLVFQTDCVMFREGINDWLYYDFAGANYFHPEHVAPRIGGIQGGFSLRKRSTMLECLQKVSWHTIQYYRTGLSLDPLTCGHEDVFFTHACEILKKKVPDVNDRKYFSIEAEQFEHPIAHHGTTKTYFPDGFWKSIISRCEDRAMWSSS